MWVGSKSKEAPGPRAPRRPISSPGPPATPFAPEGTGVEGSTPLSGGAAAVYVREMNTFGTYEVCKANPPSNDVCRSGFGVDRGVAVNENTGDVYVRNERSLEEYSAKGEYIRSFGGEMVISGPDDVTPTNAKQEIEIPTAVSGGTCTARIWRRRNRADRLQRERGDGRVGAGSAAEHRRRRHCRRRR